MVSKDTGIVVYLYDKLYNNKPTSNDVKFEISPKILKHPRKISLESFAEEISINGKVSVICKFKDDKQSSGKYDRPKRNKELLQQEIIMLDFDNNNSNEEYFTYSDALNNEYIKNNALFIYTTFNHSEEINKFRVCFKLDSKVRDFNVIENIYQAAFSRFTQVDTSCGQTSRLFYGSNAGFEVINWDNTLSVKDSLKEYSLLKESNKKVTSPSKRSQEIASINKDLYTSIIADEDVVWKCLKNKSYYQAKKLIDKKIENNLLKLAGTSFNDRRTFKLQMINKLELKEFLDLPEDTYFHDIFHDESNPSATVYIGADKEKPLYKCFSESHYFVGDSIDVVSKLTGKGFVDTIDFIRELLHVNIEQDSKIEEIKEYTQDLIDLMKSTDVQETSPHFCKLFGSARGAVVETLNVLLENIYIDPKTLRKYYMQYMSLETLSVKVSAKLYLNEPISTSKMRHIVNLMSLTDLIIKLPDKKIPLNLLNNLRESQVQQHHNVRTDVYELVQEFPDAKVKLVSIDDYSKVLTEKGLSRTTISYDRLHLNLGVETATKVFAQKKTKEVSVSKITTSIEDYVVEKTHENIGNFGFVKQDALILAITRKFHIKKVEAKSRLITIEHNFLASYDLVAVRLNKQYKEKFNVPQTEKSIKIYIPSDEVIN